MSFDDADDVAPPKSPWSINATSRPALAASYATRPPTMPPPMTSRSATSPSSPSNAAARLSTASLAMPVDPGDGRQHFVELCLVELRVQRQEDDVAHDPGGR